MRAARRAPRGLLVAALLLPACGGGSDGGGSSSSSDSLAYPFDGAASGKEDVFGRSLVGAPDPYQPHLALPGEPNASEAARQSNMRLRRELAWETARKVLEPAPLLGLANQLEARPDCAKPTDDRDLAQCSRKSSADACAAVASGEVAGICLWDEAASRCSPGCDNLRLPDGRAIPTVPRFSTWYGVEDIGRIFRHAYTALGLEAQVAREPLSDLLIGRALRADHTQIERSSRWPLQRYTTAVIDLFGCELGPEPDESPDDHAARCALARQSKFSGSSAAGGGIARLVYSPASVVHMMRNYGEILECAGTHPEGTWCNDGETPCIDPPDNFSSCFRTEFPADAGNPWAAMDPEQAGDVAGLPAAGGSVVIKATWARVGFGFDLPAFDTNAEALGRRLAPGKLALWGTEGDRQHPAPSDLNAALSPGPDAIHTIATSSGSIYRLVGLHIMTKELRHWQWITLWWSDEPDTDFGEDRPAAFAKLPAAWSNYKMCVVVDYLESDQDVVGRFNDLPGLQAALAATDPGPGKPTWCSNPYIEHGAGNARTNCIGCHQHAGSRLDEDRRPFDLEALIADESHDLSPGHRYPANGRLRRRHGHATDYSWAFSRLDDLTELIRREVEHRGASDERWVRLNDLLIAEGDAERGEAVFRAATPEQTCTECHGENGEGGRGPAYEQVFASKTDWQLLSTIIAGRGEMPAWGELLTDAQLADLFAYLKLSFAAE